MRGWGNKFSGLSAVVSHTAALFLIAWPIFADVTISVILLLFTATFRFLIR